MSGNRFSLQSIHLYIVVLEPQADVDMNRLDLCIPSLLLVQNEASKKNLRVKGIFSKLTSIYADGQSLVSKTIKSRRTS